MIITPSDRISTVETYYFARKLHEIVEINDLGEQVINLGIGSPDLAPPSAVVDALLEDARDEKANAYQPYWGLPELRQAFADFYETAYGVKLDPMREVLPLMGSKEGIMHISMSFLNPGDRVLAPNPGYPSYTATAKLAGAEVINYPLRESNGWKPDIDEIEKMNLDGVKIMWINYPHMPTGARAGKDDFRQLIEMALRNNILICHDNPYSYILNDDPHSPMEIDGAMECCLELTSLSKIFHMAGWRVGSVVGSRAYLEAILKFKSNMDSGMYRPVQKAAISALSQGREWFSYINDVYKQRRNKAWELFDLLDCRYDADSAGLFVWAKAPDYIADVEDWTDEILRKARVFITPGFVFGSQGERYLRMSLCNAVNDYKKAFSRIDEKIIQSIAQA